MNDDLMWDLLSDGNRRLILSMLKKSEKTPNEMLSFLDISASGLSKHLRRLKDSGLVKEERKGKQRVYTLNRDKPQSREEFFEVVLERSMKSMQEYFKNKKSRKDTRESK